MTDWKIKTFGALAVILVAATIGLLFTATMKIARLPNVIRAAKEQPRPYIGLYDVKVQSSYELRGTHEIYPGYNEGTEEIIVTLVFENWGDVPGDIYEGAYEVMIVNPEGKVLKPSILKQELRGVVLLPGQKVVRRFMFNRKQSARDMNIFVHDKPSSHLFLLGDLKYRGPAGEEFMFQAGYRVHSPQAYTRLYYADMIYSLTDASGNWEIMDSKRAGDDE